MQPLFKLITRIQNIRFEKEIVTFLSLMQEKTIITSDFQTLQIFEKYKCSINKERFNYTGPFMKGLLKKLSNECWIFIEKYNDNEFNGYAFINNSAYIFNTKLSNFLENINSIIPYLSENSFEEFIQLSIEKYGNIENVLKLSHVEVELLKKYYKDEIELAFKNCFFDLILNNSTENYIHKKLHISLKEIKYYSSFYAEDILKFKNSCINNEYIDYYSNGKIKIKCPFRNGLINGKVILYHDNGVIKKELDYLKGFLNGYVKTYDKNGKLTFSKKKHVINNLNHYSNICENVSSNYEELFIYAVNLNWEVLEFIPDSIKTKDLYIELFNKNWQCIKYFPNKYRTIEICENAIEQSIEAVKEIPNKYKTKEMCEKYFYECSQTLQYIPEKYRTKEMCELATKQNWENIKNVPNEFKSKEMCLNAFSKNVNAIKYIPSEFLTSDICKIAIKKNAQLIKDIPRDFITEELCFLTVKEDFECLKYIPPEQRTINLYYYMLDKNVNAIKYIPSEFLTSNICKIAIKKKGLLIKDIPQNLVDDELCILALQQNWECVKYLPETFQQINIIKHAIIQNYKAISYVKLKNEDELIEYIRLNDNIFKHLPIKYKSEKICEIALQSNVKNIEYIPTNSMTENICNYFLQKVEQVNISNEFKNKWISKIKSIKNVSLSLNNENIKKQKNTLDDLLKSYQGINDLISIIDARDKIFNFVLIKNKFNVINPIYKDKFSNITPTSTSLKIKSEYKNISYAWLFRKNCLEICLEIPIKEENLSKYFDNLEKELKKYFKETLIVGRTKTKTIVYLSYAKYSLQWATNTMNEFINVMNNALNNYYIDKKDNVNNNSLIDKKENIENKITVNIFKKSDNDNTVSIHYKDGKEVSVQLTRYERNPKNRALALKYHGNTCLACGFNFNDFYGKELANDFIEVHHIKPVSSGEYEINPETDLVPLCSNCHSMIHHEKNPPRTIDEIKNRYKFNK